MAVEPLAENYRAFDGHLPFGRAPALLLVDMVVAYIDPDAPLYAGPGATAAVAEAAALADVARGAGIPVLFTNVSYRADGRDGGLFYRKLPVLRAFVAGSASAGFPPELTPHPDDIIVTKNYASAFFGTSLAATLNAMRIDTVLIGGFSTSGCVRATALDTLQHGFAPFVVRDICADRHPAPHEANLFDLQAKYAEVISADDARQLIRDRAR